MYLHLLYARVIYKMEDICGHNFHQFLLSVLRCPDLCIQLGTF